MKLKLQATYKPTGQSTEYGPWEQHPDEKIALSRIAFAHGFVAGWNNREIGEDFKPEEMSYEVVEVVEQPQNNVIGHLVAHATASVTHPDGSVS